MMGDADDDALIAFEVLLRAHHEAAFRLAVALLRDATEAEDVVQVAAIRAWRALSRGRKVDSEQAWFLGIVANECRSATRRRWWSVLRFAELPRSAPTSRSDDSIDLRQALARLPHTQRVVILLRYYLDLPYAEIGAIAGLSEPAARARADRALQSLERQLSTSEVVP
jgi:RNA polymerase sigma-70 factor (ECF subfamily)